MLKHIPNLLTVFRMLLVPIFAYVYFSELANAQYLALIIFIIASATDILDGYLARKYDLITAVGTVLDPLADKLMLLTVLTCLWLTDKVHVIVIIIILSKELFLIVSGVLLYLKREKTVIPSNILGKIATVLFSLTIVLILLNIPRVLGDMLIISALLMKFIAILSYIKIYNKNHRKTV
ncbi:MULTISPECIES: CDP-diacylglycerol--glycerol-3-phosphate 3-phosphatidyltransferase [unclassified Fusibacter]|uniref:CDP-diacylglycerol--glycerol-3-phosphate 3-phosphatidyltransferase n=1 Tax=unclassified Fusibacter TaxID=2624464 RepID=UPI0010120763|nr:MULTISPECIES: CDP-diacylglycerol--glycerol-3-phosphate 3-phosphatidyltransferase [unclassified Fusibacter]MCK8061433.1 CDP-diacylglycerol--glycerol-3-phosphate 3-phosphatidyltransferase [Fusibacter sp. A2]NPE23620.1 CDP-diacylglycerol--glycerol-3-phosphate 3-phosphatidyltransferase [Fusibacter sp. A1]RXV58893.1 CDP-diacylglycerol--glycerol-3-phosphate 3-phosphatidyltransferase [Fusibacter sp. A1]